MASNHADPTRKEKRTRPGRETTLPTWDTTTNRIRGTLRLTCMYCFSYGNVRQYKVKEHMRMCDAGPEELRGSERDGFIDEYLGKIMNARKAFGKNIFINPRDFEERPYSKKDVMAILVQYGHSAVPEKAELKYTSRPLPVNVTGRTLDKTRRSSHD